jgi:hypothetical protein
VTLHRDGVVRADDDEVEPVDPVRDRSELDVPRPVIAPA